MTETTATKKEGIEVHVINPDEVIFRGNVRSLSGQNENGPFDILSLHTNFVTIIDGSITLHQLDGAKKEIQVGKGIVKVFEDIVYVFVGIDQSVGLNPAKKPATDTETKRS